MQAKLKFRDTDIKRLSNSIREISRILNKDESDLVRQSTVFFVQSIVKITPPGQARPSRLAKKHKTRPIEQLPSNKNIYGYRKSNGKIGFFETPKRLSRSQTTKRGLKLIKRGIKFWNKRDNKWDYIKYDPRMDKAEVDKLRKITYAGAAKAGWIQIYKQMGEVAKAEPFPNRKRISRYTKWDRKGQVGVKLENLVDYVGKIAPNSVSQALRKVNSRMEYIYRKRIEKRIATRWRA